MVWVMVVVAIAVLGVAAWAGTGRLGEMPEAVSDRPKPHLPEGSVDAAFVEALSIPLASTGYRCSQVDAHLEAHVAGEADIPEPSFDVVRHGYDMQVVDAVLERCQSSHGFTGEEGPPEAAMQEPTSDKPVSDEVEPVQQIVPPDDDFVSPREPAEATSRDLPAV